ncbi:MAG: hypothetical protein IIB62_00325 [Proteobacteria bacterium]|nr:hypothetical protein [Pseudomonadota bacterium]
MPEQHNQDLAALVDETICTLSEKGIAAIDLAPLFKLREAVMAQDNPESAGASAPAPAKHYDSKERRSTEEVSDALMARVSAIIDVLVQGGQTPEQAAQVITRQLLAVGDKLPSSGGDARAWKNVLYWRNNLIHHKREGAAWDVYCAFKEELANIPPADRLRIAFGEQLWDKRRQENSARESA